jgi:hypothetical protein
MNMGRRIWHVFLLVLAFSAILPAVTLAQSGIAGVVKDATGAVLPGVTVEATSPALIEKVRSVVTDSAGLYAIVDLRPGTYTVVFTLTGFTPVHREGIQLPGAFTATVNAEMRVGAIEEAVTVTGQVPQVDIQSVTNKTVLSDELLEAIPAVRLAHSYVLYIPGVSGTAIGSQHSGHVANKNLAIHGGRVGELNSAIDGSTLRVTGSTYDRSFLGTAVIEDLSIETGGLSAEHQTGGIYANIIPKTGGNAFSAFMYIGHASEKLKGNNLTDDLRSRGLTSNPGHRKLLDVNPSFGGPIMRDKLWFYSSFRHAVNEQYVAGMFYNKTPRAWTYTPDLTRPAMFNTLDNSGDTRLTWQVSPKNNVGLYFSLSPHHVFQRNTSIYETREGIPISPEATAYDVERPNSFTQVVWKSPVSNRLLLEAAATHHNYDYNTRPQFDPPVSPDVWAARELSTNMLFRAVTPVGNNEGSYGHHPNKTYSARASAAYITGSHTAKVGFQIQAGSFAEKDLYSNGDILVTLLNGVPRSLTMVAHPLDNYSNLNADLGLYAQDRWTFKRLTLNYGVRYDYFNASIPAQHQKAGRFVPARDYEAVSDVPNWKDISPRLGASYDLFGDSKTALKAFLGRYVARQGLAGLPANNNPAKRAVTTVNRTWNDENGDYVPDCELLNPLANGECGRFSNADFGKPNVRATNYDEQVLHGVGKRGYNWETSAVLQRQLPAGVSLALGYYRRWYGNFTLTDNLAVTPADYDSFCITAPVDSRLPGGGGQEICGLYDLNPAKFGLVDNFVTHSKAYGKQREVYDGFDVTLNARFGHGGLLTGGLSSGRTAINQCFAVDSPGQLRFCDVKPPFRTDVKFMGSHPLPWGLQASGVIQSTPGPEITADYVASNAEILPSLGRNLSAGANGTVIVPVIAPGTMYASRVTQVDLRLSRIFNIGRIRLVGNIDVFNIFNASGIQQQNLRYGPDWLRPTLIQGARYLQWSTQVSF